MEEVGEFYSLVDLSIFFFFLFVSLKFKATSIEIEYDGVLAHLDP